MDNITVNKDIFKFKYLPDYASYILDNKLEEFVLIGIRFCREVDLPMLRPLSKFTENELVKMSLESNRQILEGIKANNAGVFIENNLNNWIANKIQGLGSDSNKTLDRSEVVAEDVTLAFYIRRKLFSFFLQSYTQNVVLQKLIIEETDFYTTQEELLTLKVYIAIQKEIDQHIIVSKQAPN